MPLGDTGEVDRWVERERPSGMAVLTAARFLAELESVPWAAPSVPITDLAEQPVFDFRRVSLSVPGEEHPVRIWYRHYYLGDVVDIWAITSR